MTKRGGKKLFHGSRTVGGNDFFYWTAVHGDAGELADNGLMSLHDFPA